MATSTQQIRFCVSPDGVPIACATSGQGPPLVKAANWLSHLEFDLDNPAFRKLFTTQFIPAGTPEQYRGFNELERVSTTPANAARFMREFNEIDVVALLPQVPCPTLVSHASLKFLRVRSAFVLL